MMAQSIKPFCHGYSFTLLVFAYILFVIFGGLVFMALEQPEQDLLVAEVQKRHARFLKNHHCINESNLEHLLKKVVFAGKRGLNVLNSISDDYNFDFTSSLFFVTTYLTTTGYGTTVPLSDEGRMFCIFYCLFGIPFTFLLLSSLTNALLPKVTHAPIRHLHIYWGLSYNTTALLYCGMLATCTATLFFLLPAFVLCLMEKDWSFLESLYYCFTSLSTIGLADYLPGRTHSLAARKMLEFATSCYLLLGLVVLLVVMESFWQLQQVQALVCLFVDPWVGELTEEDVDKLVPSEGLVEEAHYAAPISIISYSQSGVSTVNVLEEAEKKTASPPFHPDIIVLSPQHNRLTK